ncbi:MAG: hypothetical protein JSS60_05275 [Verrucomicrobia bacterium]|nr:hypothetical protein [Verrucomicrobiota bacterium]
MSWKTIFIATLCTAALTPAFSKQHSISIEKAAETGASSQCFFTPPQGWEIADPKSLSPRVKIAFLKNTGKGFCPSINLAVEPTQVSLNEYLKAVRAIHEQDRSNHWRALGKVRTSAGLAQLTEIDSTTEWGPIRMLQLIFIKEGRAYVLTAAALKEEFSNFYKEIQTSFRSLTLTTDLVSTIPQLERRETLKQKQQQLIHAAEEALAAASEPTNLLEDPLFQEKHWLPFQQAVLTNFSDMGAFWQVLLLRDIQEKLLAFKLPEHSSEAQPENN